MNKSQFAQRDLSLFGVKGKIGIGENISDGNYTCRTNFIRVYAKTDVVLKNTNIHIGDGIELPQGFVEFFSVKEGDVIEVKGSVNISSID